MDETQGYCPVFHRAVELIGRRWNGPIIRALLDGADRFGEIRSRIPGLTDRLLAQATQDNEHQSSRIYLRVPCCVASEIMALVPSRAEPV